MQEDTQTSSPISPRVPVAEDISDNLELGVESARDNQIQESFLNRKVVGGMILGFALGFAVTRLFVAKEAV